MVERPDPAEHPNRQPPPNYFSRRVQTRLLMLVGAFMLVIFLMEEARKPKYYEWMWGNQIPARESAAAEALDTRITPPPPTDSTTSIPGTIDTAANRYDEATLTEAGKRSDDPVGRASIDAWGRMLGELTLAQRENLNVAMLARRQGKVIDHDALPVLAATTAALEAELQEYVNNARESLVGNDELAEDELAAWESVLDRLESAWSKRWKPGLNQLGLTVTSNLPALDEIQSLIDELNLAAVRDNTLAPSAERHAWIRFIEKLQSSKQTDLEAQSLGVVGFLQLHDQPKDYRGKVVTIRGQAKLGYRVTARKNPLGVDEYRLLWLRPRGGPNTLVAIYCLETPSLPPLKHKDRDRGVTELDHEVQVTGYFFKKWAYRAQDGLRTAPQILAKSVVVESSPVWADSSEPPSNQMLLIVVIVAALGGVGVAVVFYALNQWPSRAAQLVTRTNPKVDSIDPNQVSKGVTNELQALEESERSAAEETRDTATEE